MEIIYTLSFQSSVSACQAFHPVHQILPSIETGYHYDKIDKLIITYKK